jgi:hypothetical protein
MILEGDKLWRARNEKGEVVLPPAHYRDAFVLVVLPVVPDIYL